MTDLALVPLERLPEDFDLDTFSCGEPTLDGWLKRHARLAEGRTARTYVLSAGPRVAAYYCLATGHVERATLPRRHRHGNPDPVPVFVLGRLAVDAAYQRRGLGADLLRHCLGQCLAAGTLVGARGLVVHPLNEGLVAYYERLGFLPLAGSGRALLLLNETMADAAGNG